LGCIIKWLGCIIQWLGCIIKWLGCIIKWFVYLCSLVSLTKMMIGRVYIMVRWMGSWEVGVLLSVTSKYKQIYRMRCRCLLIYNVCCQRQPVLYKLYFKKEAIPVCVWSIPCLYSCYCLWITDLLDLMLL